LRSHYFTLPLRTDVTRRHLDYWILRRLPAPSSISPSEVIMGNYASSMRSVKVLSIATTLSAVQSQDPTVTVGNFTFISSYSSYTPSLRCEGLLLGSGSITIAGSIADD